MVGTRGHPVCDAIRGLQITVVGSDICFPLSVYLMIHQDICHAAVNCRSTDCRRGLVLGFVDISKTLCDTSGIIGPFGSLFEVVYLATDATGSERSHIASTAVGTTLLTIPSETRLGCGWLWYVVVAFGVFLVR